MYMKLKLMFLVFAVGVFLIAAPSWAEAAGDRTLKKGTSGSNVIELQDSLMTKGVFPYHTSTGYFGSITKESVKDFQRLRNLKVDGIAGPQTNQAIKVLRQGDIGKPVIHIQSQLKQTGHLASNIDGIYGSGTATSVRGFQQQEGLEIDGIVGPRTRAALDEKAERRTAAGKEMTVESTAYTADCSGCSGVTKMGINLKKYPDAKVIAVDPSVIPLGSLVEVEGYGIAIAADVGGGVNGKTIDVFINDRDEAIQWGRKNVELNIVE